MQDVLVHSRSYEKRTAAAALGLRIAATLGGDWTGVYVCQQPLYAAPAFAPELIAAAIAIARELARDARQARQGFLDWTAAAGVAHGDWLVAEGPVDDALLQAATWHDLLVVDHAEEDAGVAWDLPGVLLTADVPCIVAPRRGEAGEGAFRRVAIGWNGSPEAMRAVHQALPLLRGGRVLLLCGEERSLRGGVEWNPRFELAEYLHRHGIEAERQDVTARYDDVGSVLLEEAHRFGADLLVMGAYGRSRFSEWALGGATRDVLAWAEIPVLFRH